MFKRKEPVAIPNPPMPQVPKVERRTLLELKEELESREEQEQQSEQEQEISEEFVIKALDELKNVALSLDARVSAIEASLFRLKALV